MASEKYCLVPGCLDKSLSGFKPGYGFCNFHLVEKICGSTWAKHCRDLERVNAGLQATVLEPLHAIAAKNILQGETITTEENYDKARLLLARFNKDNR